MKENTLGEKAMKKRTAIVSLGIALIVLVPASPLISASFSATDPTPAQVAPGTASAPVVALRAGSGATIAFLTQNGQTIDSISPQTRDLPHLVLHRNGSLASSDERTLIVEVSGIQVPASGATVTLEVTTQHENPDTSSGEGIIVWRESQHIASTPDTAQMNATAIFTHEFTETVLADTETTATPTDYFRYDIAVIDSNDPVSEPRHTIAQDHAFLMENQVIARLPEVREEADGAAPDDLVITYCDMFPFQRSGRDISTRLLRADVPGFIQTHLLSQMVEAFRVQTDVWGFTWHQAWTGYRPDENAGRLGVALSDGQTWFHGSAPVKGHSGISINTNGGDNDFYDTLADAIMSNFHHELFHNLQQSINQSSGGNGDVDGADNAWQFISEGTAVLAPSVGQPGLQFAETAAQRDHIFNANRFLGSALKSYEKMSPYNAVIYWRFLYEQCGGIEDGIEDPAAGMQVINRTLEALYSQDIVDISSSSDLVETLPRIMDHALASADFCPFRTYEDSLVHFSRSIYQLGLDGGRCTGAGDSAECGLHDPHDLYRDPTPATITYTGAEQKQSGQIWSSYRMAAVDVKLDPSTDGQALAIAFSVAPDAGAEFSVELWKLVDSSPDAKPQRIPAQSAGPETLTSTNADGHLVYTIPQIDTAEYNQLGLIITRVDGNESSDPFGQFTIELQAVGA